MATAAVRGRLGSSSPRASVAEVYDPCPGLTTPVLCEPAAHDAGFEPDEAERDGIRFVVSVQRISNGASGGRFAALPKPASRPYQTRLLRRETRNAHECPHAAHCLRPMHSTRRQLTVSRSPSLHSVKLDRCSPLSADSPGSHSVSQSALLHERCMGEEEECEGLAAVRCAFHICSRPLRRGSDSECRSIFLLLVSFLYFAFFRYGAASLRAMVHFHRSRGTWAKSLHWRRWSLISSTKRSHGWRHNRNSRFSGAFNRLRLPCLHPPPADFLCSVFSVKRC